MPLRTGMATLSVEHAARIATSRRLTNRCRRRAGLAILSGAAVHEWIQHVGTDFNSPPREQARADRGGRSRSRRNRGGHAGTWDTNRKATFPPRHTQPCIQDSTASRRLDVVRCAEHPRFLTPHPVSATVDPIGADLTTNGRYPTSTDCGRTMRRMSLAAAAVHPLQCRRVRVHGTLWVGERRRRCGCSEAGEA